ncbi:cell division control protein 21, partial [mine drainage metagenome]
AMEQQSFAYDTRIQVGTGATVLIGEFVDSLINSNAPTVKEGVDCQILEIEEPIEVPTSDFEGTGLTTIKQVSRHLSPREMIRIELEDGSSVKVTRNHPFWAVKNGSLELVDAEEVTASDYVVSMNTGKIDRQERDYLEDLASATGARKWFQDLTLKRIARTSTVPYS